MTFFTLSISEAVERLRRRDPALKRIILNSQGYNDAEVAEMVDCLLSHPDVVTYVHLDRNQLTNETGVKLARYVATSRTIQHLDLSHNQLSEATYLALAEALRVNTSLRCLYLFFNQAISIENRSCIDAAFVDALILNPSRTAGWLQLYSLDPDDFKRLQPIANELGHPSLQSLLATHFLRSELMVF